MPRFSLIVPTLGRTKEVDELFASLVDQNEDERIVPLVEALPAGISVRHLRLREKNPSAARNAGLAVSSGAIVAFPDDDCWYPPHLLDRVDAWFRENPEYSVLAVGALDNAGVPSGNRW